MGTIVRMLPRTGPSCKHPKCRANGRKCQEKKPKSEQRGLEAPGTLKLAKGLYAGCGDWLAVALKDAFRTKNSALDLAAFKACLKENGVEAPKVDMDRHSAIGPFRMCAGLMLRRRALKVGHVVIGGKKIAAPGAKKNGRKAKTTT